MQNTNSLRDEVLLQHQKLKGQPLSKKAEYFWHYYKTQTIIVILVLCMLGNVFYSMATRKETVLSIACINASPDIETDILAYNFENYLGINSKKQQVVIDSTYYINVDSVDTYSQKFQTNVMAGVLDVVLADEANFDFYSKQGLFQDLTNILSKKDLENYQENLYYADIPYDDSTQQVPVGIRISSTDNIGYPNSNAYLGILTGTEHTDTALSYLHYLENI